MNDFNVPADILETASQQKVPIIVIIREFFADAIQDAQVSDEDIANYAEQNALPDSMLDWTQDNFLAAEKFLENFYSKEAETAEERLAERVKVKMAVNMLKSLKMDAEFSSMNFARAIEFFLGSDDIKTMMNALGTAQREELRSNMLEKFSLIASGRAMELHHLSTDEEGLRTSEFEKREYMLDDLTASLRDLMLRVMHS
ncbi:MAG: hypothetical protein JWM56_736 [Candidatus Peribacteria bacterium]|nr:hypothetical protein [Candidatus Peribacteria bacterium]